MTTENEDRSDVLAYHHSLAAELTAIRDRVRNLIRHWATDGAFKEAALRHVLRRYLPETLQIGTGFIVNNRREFSTQIDVLIVDRSHPTLFKDGDLLIVTPMAVQAIIEVKTALSGPQAFNESLGKLARCKRMCRDCPTSAQFTGLFVYNAADNQARNIVESVKRLCDDGNDRVDAVAYGPDMLGFFHEPSRLPNADHLETLWAVWEVPRLAPAYFLSSILNRISGLHVMFNPVAWFPDQVENRLLYYLDKSGNVIEYQQGR